MSTRRPSADSAAARRPKPRAALTRERVLKAALRLADTKGLDALSMRRLAEALKVEAMSLYHHVAGKDDVLDGITDLVVAEIEVPTIGGDWRAALRARAISARAALRRHPWAAMLLLSRVNVGPAMLRYVDATIGCLRTAGFSFEQADHAWNALDSFVYGFTLQEQHFPIKPEEFAVRAREYLPMLPPELFPHTRAMAEVIIAGEYSGVPQFEFGLDLILDGLARTASRGR